MGPGVGYVPAVAAHGFARVPTSVPAPLLGRRALIADLQDRAGQGRSTLLLGAPDTGRTRVLEELRSGYDGPTLWLSGSSPDRGAPVPDLSSASDDPLLVLVDDLEAMPVGIIDTLAAAVASSATVVIAAALAGRHLGFTRSEPWACGDWGIARLRPLEPGAVTALVHHVLGGPAEPAIITDLFRSCGGHPRATAELLARAVAAGCVHLDGEVWRRVAPMPAYQLAAASDPVLRALGPASLADAELVAFGAPLPMRVAAQLMSSQGQRELDRRGITVVRPGQDPLLELAQPVHGEVLRSGVTGERRVRIARRLAEAHDAADLPPATLLRVARWRLDAGGWSSDRWRSAALLARSLGHDGLAEQAARRAVELGGAFPDHLALGTVLAERGDPQGARAALSDATDTAHSANERVLVLATETANRGAAEGSDVRATSTDLTRHLEGLDAGHARASVAASAAAAAAFRGDHDQVRELAAFGADDRSRCTTARVGHALVAFDRLEPARTTVGVPDLQLPSLPFAAAIERGLGLLEGDAPVPERRADADAERDTAIVEGRADAPWWMAIVGWLHVAAGDLAGADRALVEAASGLREADPLGLVPGIVADRALVSALAGAPSEARVHLVEFGAGDASCRDHVRAELVEAWLTAHHDGAASGAAHAVDVGDRARAVGQLRAAVRAWHVAVRLGHPEHVAARLATCGDVADHPLVRRTRGHAEALERGRPAALHTLAIDLAAQGRTLVAAEVAAQAARLGGVRSAALARGLPAVCPAVRTPALAGTEPAQLTPRQRCIAAAVVEGETPRTIAARIGLSIRTVENHLSRVYRELGVAGRRQLRRVHRVDTPLFANP